MRGTCVLNEAQISRIITMGSRTVIAPVKTRYRRSDTFIDQCADDPAWGILDCPFKPGDLLAVRETWNVCLLGDIPYLCFRASGRNREPGTPISFDLYEELSRKTAAVFGSWRSARSMPAKIARLKIKIFSVNQLKRSQICDCDILDSLGLDPWGPIEDAKEFWDKSFARKFRWDKDPSMWVYKIEPSLYGEAL
jgi:hypothetical protein